MTILLLSKICAGTGGSSVCYGDSGGPLMLRDPGSGRWSAVGVTSFGLPDCELQGVPDVFARVDSYLELAVRQSEGGDADDAPPAAVGYLFIIYLFISLYLFI